MKALHSFYMRIREPFLFVLLTVNGRTSCGLEVLKVMASPEAVSFSAAIARLA